MSARMATLDLPKIKLFWNKGYDVMVFVYDLSNNILSRDLILQMLLCDMFGNSSISRKTVVITSIL